MVALDWVHGKIKPIKLLNDNVGSVLVRFNDLGLTAFPTVVRHVVASPEDECWVEVSLDVLEHIPHRGLRQITEVGAPFAGLEPGLSGVAIDCTAAEGQIAEHARADGVLCIDVRVCEVDGRNSLTGAIA